MELIVVVLIDQGCCPDHHTTTTMFEAWLDVLGSAVLVLYHNGTPLAKRSTFISSIHRDFSPRMCLRSSICFLTNMRQAIGSFWSVVDLPFELFHWGRFSGTSLKRFSFWLLNCEHQSYLRQVRLEGDFWVTSWMNYWWILAAILVNLLLLRGFTTVLWIMALTVFHCNPKALEMAFASFPKR